MGVMFPVCPNCLQPKTEGHRCNLTIPAPPKPQTVKQAAIDRQKTERKHYEHDLELEHSEVRVTFYMEHPKEFDPKWLQEYLTEILELPELLENFPTVEDYYIKWVTVDGS